MTKKRVVNRTRHQEGPPKSRLALIATNLKKLMERSHLSEHELSRRTKIKQPIINRLLSGENQNPKLNTIKPIADYFMLTISQLIGEEDIENSWKGMTNKEHQGWVEVPILNSETTKNLPQRSIVTECSLSKRAFAILMPDESMTPVIPEGSIAIIEPDIRFENKNIVAVQFNNELTIRNFFLVSGVSCISPANDKFGTIAPLSNNQKILGVVIRTIFNHTHS